MKIKLVIALFAYWIIFSQLVGCGGTTPVKPNKCEDRQIFQPADNHVAALAALSAKYKSDDVPDDAFDVLGNSDMFRVVER